MSLLITHFDFVVTLFVLNIYFTEKKINYEKLPPDQSIDKLASLKKMVTFCFKLSNFTKTSDDPVPVVFAGGSV